MEISNAKKMVAVDKVLKFYEGVALHPRGYTRDTGVAFVDFIHGFDTACRLLFNTSEYHLHFEDVIRSRGWKVNALHPVAQMQAKGLADAEVIAEIIAIEVEVWARVRNELSQS